MSVPIINMNYLPENTRGLFLVLKAQAFCSKYSLVGSTALSLQIGHRLSEDLDFIFDGEKLNINSIKRNILKSFPQSRIIRQDHQWQIDFEINQVKVIFFSSGAIAIPFSVQTHAFKEGKMQFAGTLAVVALKLSAIAQRNTIRDYYDLYYLARYYHPLLELITFTKQIIPGLSPVTYSETLIYTKDIVEDSIATHLSPKEVVNKEQIAQFFS